MNDSEYARLDPEKVLLHRAASLLVLVLLVWLQFNGWISGGVRLIAIQLIATAFIWFSEDHYMDLVLRRCVSYRTVAWLALVGIPVASELYRLFLRSLS